GPGVCPYTGSSEVRNNWSGYNSMVTDGVELYWTNPDAVRAIRKDGTNLRTLYALAAFVPANGNLQPAIAVDNSWIYVMPDTYDARIFEANKLGGQTPNLLQMMPVFP